MVCLYSLTMKLLFGSYKLFHAQKKWNPAFRYFYQIFPAPCCKHHFCEECLTWLVWTTEPACPPQPLLGSYLLWNCLETELCGLLIGLSPQWLGRWVHLIQRWALGSPCIYRDKLHPQEENTYFDMFSSSHRALSPYFLLHPPPFPTSLSISCSIQIGKRGLLFLYPIREVVVFYYV